jgi:hypothetical protein
MVLAILMLILSALACESTGSTVGSHRACRSTIGSGQCEGSRKKLSGTVTEDIENDRISSFDTIPVEITVSVESGAVRVSCKDPDGETPSAQASPGSPAALSADCEGDFDELEVTFEALDGDATGVSYTINYQVP